MGCRTPWWRLPRRVRDLAGAVQDQIVVVDATGRERGPSVLEHLRRSGVPAAAGDLSTRAGTDVLLLLPILAGLARPPAVATDAVGLLDADSVDDRSPFAPARLVVAWFVEDGARADLATPGAGGDRCANGAALLLVLQP